MRKTMFLMLCASVFFGFLATSCDKDEEQNTVDTEEQTVDENGSEEQSSAYSVIQDQIIGTNWYLEYKHGADDYNNSEFKRSVYYTFSENKYYEINENGDKWERGSYEILQNDDIACNDHILCWYFTLEEVKLSNDTLYFGNYKEQMSGYFVRKEVVDNSKVK